MPHDQETTARERQVWKEPTPCPCHPDRCVERPDGDSCGSARRSSSRKPPATSCGLATRGGLSLHSPLQVRESNSRCTCLFGGLQARETSHLQAGVLHIPEPSVTVPRRTGQADPSHKGAWRATFIVTWHTWKYPASKTYVRPGEAVGRKGSAILLRQSTYILAGETPLLPQLPDSPRPTARQLTPRLWVMCRTRRRPGSCRSLQWSTQVLLYPSCVFIPCVPTGASLTSGGMKRLAPRDSAVPSRPPRG